MLWPAASFDVEGGFGCERARVFREGGTQAVRRHRMKETETDGMLWCDYRQVNGAAE